MTKSFQITPAYAKGLAIIATLVIFGMDWWTPVNINIAIFYTCVIVMLAWTQCLRWLWGGTMLTVGLTMLDLTNGQGPGQNFTWVEYTNRVITGCMLIVTGGFVHFSMRLARQLDTNKRLLDEIAERKRAEESLRQAQDELAHFNRVMTMGELAASIAHEVSQPLSGIAINGNASLRWLANVDSPSPDLEEARQATERIVRDGKRAGEVVLRLRNLFKKTTAEKVRLDINEVITEVVILVQHEMEKKRVSLRMELADNLPPVTGDRVQLQQVMLNLILNGADAMATIEDRPRQLIIRTTDNQGQELRVEVQDNGIGLDPQGLTKIFDAFYTTKPGGMGMGLSISRSIIENHGGRLWATTHDGPGSSFYFTLVKHR